MLSHFPSYSTPCDQRNLERIGKEGGSQVQHSSADDQQPASQFAREHLERLIDLTLPKNGNSAAYKAISNLCMMQLTGPQGQDQHHRPQG